MTQTSSGGPKQGPPAHQNRFAFQHNRASKLTAKILSLPISNCCPSCTRQIQWRKDFRKYKPLTVPKRCTRCQEKVIKDAYHVICNPCASRAEVCAKCLDLRSLDSSKVASSHPVEVVDSETDK